MLKDTDEAPNILILVLTIVHNVHNFLTGTFKVREGFCARVHVGPKSKDISFYLHNLVVDNLHKLYIRMI